MSRTLRFVAPVLLCVAPALAAEDGEAGRILLPHVEQITVPVSLDSGLVSAPAVGLARYAGHQAVYQGEVEVPGAAAIRLVFDTADLGDVSGSDTYLLITSLQDGHHQILAAEHLKQWKYTSAYFNGDAVSVEIYSAPGAGASQVAVSEVIAEMPSQNPRSICGTVDDRALSTDPRAGRVWPIGCTAWLFDGRTNCMNTAGHCGPLGTDIIQFNVPLSSAGGTPQHPGPQDQYAVDPVSIQTNNGGSGVGDDWATFGVFDNTNTGLSPLAAAGGQSYTLAATAPGGSGQSIRITGFGTTSSPVSPTWYLAQKTHAGPYAGVSGTNIQYATDTTGGNSGSGVEDESTGLTIGIHTHAGCDVGGGANNGTAVQHAAFQAALANPLGVCDVGLDFSFLLERPTVVATDGSTTIGVDVSADAGVVLDAGTVTLFVDSGSGFVGVPMGATGGSTFEGAFPAGDCGTTVAYYISAMDTTGTEHTEPGAGAAAAFGAFVADSFTSYADFDFETDPAWTVQDTALSTGSWDRAVPRAEGRGDPLSDFDGSGQCWVTGNGLSEDVDGGPTRLLTNVIDLSGATDPTVLYARWFDSNLADADNLTIEFSDNGGSSWTTVDSVVGLASTGWVEQSITVADHVALTSQFRARFSCSDNPNDSVTEAAIDAFRVLDLVCGASGCTFADCDANGVLNVDDIDCFVAAFLGSDLVAGDCDGNGVLNVDDVDCFVASFIAGCP
ncbi:MAG: hypothetical protein DHS20C14_04640 [Phycisphaeraceae bacterium]|nr:MAG: hypothetical protein DHS20C14_04640 [Phycisphaeraceae bacterium]